MFILTCSGIEINALYFDFCKPTNFRIEALYLFFITGSYIYDAYKVENSLNELSKRAQIN